MVKSTHQVEVLAVTIDDGSAADVLRDAAQWLEEHPEWQVLDVVLGGDDDRTFLVLYAEKLSPAPGIEPPSGAIEAELPTPADILQQARATP